MPPTTLGLLVSRLDDAFSRSLAFAFRDEVRERGLRGVCFAGDDFSEGCAAPRNVAYELATPSALDGLIIGNLGAGLSSEAELQLLQRYSQLPRCTYSVRLPDAPLVGVDHAAGMRSAVSHLMQVHGHRRIAYIHGPEGNLDATLRFEGYRSALLAAGIGVDEALLAPGDFTVESASQAIALLLDERRLGFDALVAANDQMAVGAISALTARGIRVPRDVAVVGFDDAVDSRFLSPPLSTVRHPWRAQVSLAVDLLLAQLAGKRLADGLAVAADFVARNSCGCHHAAEVRPTSRDSVMPPLLDDDWLSGWAFALRRNLGARNVQLAQEVAGQLVAHLWLAATAEGKEFLPLLERTISEGLGQAGSLAGWYAGLASLRDSVLGRLWDRPVLRQGVHELVHAAFQRVSYATERQQALQRIAVEREGRCLALAGERTINTFEPEAIALALREPLEQMGLGACFAARFEPGTIGAPRRAHLVVLYDTDSRPAKPPTEVYPAEQLLPEDAWPKRPGCVMVLEILHLGNEALGYALLELGPRQGALYRGLAQRLAAALKGAELAAETASQARQLRELELHRMQGELRIEREVQRWILPGESVHGELSISALLSPGSGGSAAYYDTLSNGQATWVSAGLVHGASGNSRLMVPVVQAVIASLCAQPGSATAEFVFDQVHSIFQNQDRPQGRAINSLRIVIVRCDASGEVTVAGDYAGVFQLGARGLPTALAWNDASALRGFETPVPTGAGPLGGGKLTGQAHLALDEKLLVLTEPMTVGAVSQWLAHAEPLLATPCLEGALMRWRQQVGPDPDLGLMAVRRGVSSAPPLGRA